MLEVPLKTLTELGFTIACGVLLETFVVRSVLVFDIGARLVAERAGPAPAGSAIIDAEIAAARMPEVSSRFG